MSDVQSDRVFSENDFVRTRSNYEERVDERIATKQTWTYDEDHRDGDDKIADEATSQPYGDTRVELRNFRDICDEEILIGRMRHKSPL